MMIQNSNSAEILVGADLRARHRRRNALDEHGYFTE
jgi:hypothetical protein